MPKTNQVAKQNSGSRAPIYWDPFNLDYFFDNSFMRNFFGPAMTFKVDIKDRRDHYEYKADLPGMEKENIDVDIRDGYMTISATQSKENTEDSDDFVLNERSVGTMQRTFYVGEINADEVKGTYRGGVLYLNVPKKEDKEDDGSRKVTIK